MTRQVRPKPPGRRRCVTRVLAAVVLTATVSGCTGEEAGDKPLPRRSVHEQPTLAAKPVPTEVTVAKVVGGRLKGEQRDLLEKQLRGLVSRYFDDAFLGGEYPRKDFSGALATFSPGAASRAGADRELLTNAGIGSTTEAVLPRVKQARLDVLMPGRHVVGLTARIRLVFLQHPTDGVDKRVTVSGRLLVNRKTSGPWQVFGYDLTRSSVPAGKGETR